MWWLSLLGCGAPLPPAGGPCDEATARVGELACVHRVPDAEPWEAITIEAEAVDKVRETKGLAPATTGAALQVPLFVGSGTFELHWELLAQGWPDLFPGMTWALYTQLVIDPELKEYWSGNLVQYDDGAFGFTTWGDVGYADVLSLWIQLGARFELGELVFVTNSDSQREAAASWPVGPFGVRHEEEGVRYEVYTGGEAYGTVRRFTLDELAVAEEQVGFSYQDVLVLDEAPFDVERPIAGAVTGTRQGELSHLNVRSAARGTPNCYVADAHDVLASWEGQLVRLECAESGLVVQRASLEDAEAWWDAVRPEPVDVVAPDLDTRDLAPLLGLPTDTAAEREAGVAAYGSKGTNLATLYQRIDPALQLDGFLVPMAYAADHLAAAGLSDPTFSADPAIRRDELVAFQDAVEAAPVDPALVALLVDEIVATFGSDREMVRFRSSSNAEDALAFSGAGLYDSTSVCAADSLDLDDAGPSLCDPNEPDERTIERGLRKVWASTYSVAAWEERAWYGIDQAAVGMGVLVNTRSVDEQVNAVAFTGNPTTDDDRTLIDAQVGWLDVVSAAPGVYPEQVLVDVDHGGVDEIVRVRASSEQAAPVLDDPRVEELALALWSIEAVFPVDEAPPADRTVLLDTEWKVLEDGKLIVKQIRPFLR